MAKAKERLLARGLRKKGKSIKEIVKIIGAAQSSVSLWCRDVVLSPQQIKELERRIHDPYYGNRLNYLNKLKKERNFKIKRLIKIGIKEIGKISKRELFLTGNALYWAEGFKKDSQAGFASSDPEMIKYFLKWLKDCFGYSLENLTFRITINISHKYRLDKIHEFWLTQLGNTNVHFQKPFFQKTKWKKIYENHETYFGVLRVKVRKSTDFLRKIHGWIEGLKSNTI